MGLSVVGTVFGMEIGGKVEKSGDGAGVSSLVLRVLLGAGDVVVSGISGLLVGLASLETEVLEVLVKDVMGVVFSVVRGGTVVLEAGCDGLSRVENGDEGEETDTAEVAGKELGVRDNLVSATSGLLASVETEVLEMLLASVTGVVFCVMRCGTACGVVGLLWVTATVVNSGLLKVAI